MSVAASQSHVVTSPLPTSKGEQAIYVLRSCKRAPTLENKTQPLLLAQFSVKGQSLLKGVPTLHGASFAWIIEHFH